MKNKYLFLLLLLITAIPILAQNQDIRRGGGGGTITSNTVTTALGYVPVNKAGDTMTGALSMTTGSSVGTSGAALFGIGQYQIVDNSEIVFRRFGTDYMVLASTGLRLSSADYLGWSASGVQPLAAADVFIYRDAANTLALRNGANAQTFRVYNTYTDASNYERVSGAWSGNVFTLQTEKAGTGTQRALQLGASGAANWQINTSGHLLAVTDNTYDIGASGATRPRNIYIGTSATVPTLNVTSSIQSGVIKVCTSAVSNALFYVSVPSTNMIGGRVLYTVNSTDGTDSQQITGTTQFGAVGKSTTVTANVTDVQNTSTVSAGTLTAVVTANVSTNNVFALMITPTTSLTTTNLVVKWRLETPGTYTVNPL